MFESEVVHGDWHVIDTGMGVEYYPSRLSLAACLAGRKAEGVGVVTGYGARLAAECETESTPWCVFETEEQALAHVGV